MAEREWTVAPDEAGLRLDKFLASADRLGSRARAAEAIGRGKVFLNGREASRHAVATRLSGGDIVGIWMDRPGTARRRATLGAAHDLAIVYEDDTLIVVNKPAGLLTVPLPRQPGARSVYDELSAYLGPRGRRRPLVVHRIDRDTSGLVLFAKRSDAQAALRDQFKRHQAERVYCAIVYGEPSPDTGVWRDHLVWDRGALIQKKTRPNDPRGHEAISEYRVVERLGSATLIEVRLVTGKRNQIRLQARLHGHVLVGEQRYTGEAEPHRPIAFPRQALHALRLGVRHPVTGAALQFEAPMPPDLVALVDRLRRRR